MRNGIFHNKGFIYAFFGMLLLTASFINNKFLLSLFNPTTFGLIWALFSAVQIFALIIIQNKSKEIINTPPPVKKTLVLVGILHGVGVLLTWMGLSHLSPSVASLIWRFLPVLMLILGVSFLGEIFYIREIWPIAVMIFGAFLSVSVSWDELGLGVILTIIACFITAVQMAVVKKAVESISPELLILFRNLLGSLTIGTYGLLTQSLNFQVAPYAWPIIFLGAFIGETITFLFFFRSYQFWDLSRTGLVRTSEPIFVILWSYLIFGTFPQGQQLLGGVIILIGAFWLGLAARKH